MKEINEKTIIYQFEEGLNPTRTPRAPNNKPKSQQSTIQMKMEQKNSFKLKDIQKKL